jgi:hypothetical protein
MIHWTPESRALVPPLRAHSDFTLTALPFDREAWKESDLHPLIPLTLEALFA